MKAPRWFYFLWPDLVFKRCIARINSCPQTALHFCLPPRSSLPLMLLSTSQSCSVCAQTAEPGLQTPLTPGSAKSVRAQHEEAVQGSKFLLPNQSFHPGQEALVPLLWFCKKNPKNKKPTKKKNKPPHELCGSTMNYQLLTQFAMLGIKSQRIQMIKEES